MSIKRKYISIDAQSKESLQEVRLINQNNVLHAQEVRLLNPETQQMDDIKDIFFNKEDGQQIAETIKEEVKEDVKEELKDEIGETYVTKTEAQDFAVKSDLSNLATTQSLQELQQEVEDNYIPKSDEGKFIPKSRIQEIAPIDTSEPYTLEDVVGKLNELISALKDSQ